LAGVPASSGLSLRVGRETSRAVEEGGDRRRIVAEVGEDGEESGLGEREDQAEGDDRFVPKSRGEWVDCSVMNTDEHRSADQADPIPNDLYVSAFICGSLSFGPPCLRVSVVSSAFQEVMVC
jgi:hypothetical protein